MPELVRGGAPRIVITPTDGTPTRPPVSGGAVLYCVTEYFTNNTYRPNDSGIAAKETVVNIYADLGLTADVDFLNEIRNYTFNATNYGVRQWQSILTQAEAQNITDNYLAQSGGDLITVTPAACTILDPSFVEEPGANEFTFYIDGTNYIWLFNYSIDKNFVVGSAAAAFKYITLNLDDAQTIDVNVFNGNTLNNSGGTPSWFMSNAFVEGGTDGILYLGIPISVFTANTPTATAFDYNARVLDPNNVLSNLLTGTINI